MPLTHAPFMGNSLKEYTQSNYPDPFNENVWSHNEDGTYTVTKVPGEWREVCQWYGALTYDGWFKGRSAVRLWWIDDQGNRFPMFMNDFDEILDGRSNAVMDAETGPGLKIKGTWTVVKKGANYGIKPAAVIK